MFRSSRRSWLLVPLLLLTLQACGSSKPPLHHEDFLYSAVGTSGILGVGAFPLANGYTFRIRSALQDQGRSVALFQIGIPAANTDIIADAVKKAADKGLTSEFATVWVGANDLIDGVPVEAFEAELDRLLGVLQDDMDAYVAIANLPALHRFPNFVQEPVPEVTEQRVEQFNAIISDQAIARGIPVVNLVGDAISDHLVVDFDGLHPDDEGHARLAKLFMMVIRPVL